MTMIGKTLAHYRVTDKIGAGGMGEVYRATDSKLHREVAIKVLPESVAGDADRMARFQREAQVLASLSHANIASIFGLEEADGRRALVMELVDGEDLSQRLARGRLPVEEALPIALAIAEALEAAHEKGVIHRDLKPANVKVTASGKVKVLDFGLAKALEGTPGSSADAAQSPTLSLAATQAGLILGTAAYMSPEQASGKPVDRRADVWSFGVVLFELLSGKRLFDGETVSHTLADVLRADVNWSLLPPETPPAIRRLLERCLERDVRRRLRDIGEARVAIEDHLTRSQSGSLTPVKTTEPSAPARRSWLPWAVASLFGALLVASVVIPRGGPSGSATPALKVDMKITEEGLWPTLGSAFDISRDGTRIAYVTGTDASRQLHVRPINQLTGAQIAAGVDDARPYLPFFSPDGQWIGYVTTTELRKVPVSGGAPLTLCKVNRGRGASWGEDDTIVLAPSPDSGLFRVPAAGGEPQPLTTLDAAKKEASHRWPQVLPGGKAVVFTSHTLVAGDFDNASIEVVAIDTGVRKVVHAGGTYARYVPSGHLVYINKGTLFGVPFDLDKLEVTGSPAPVAQNVLASASEGSAHYAFSATGLLVYARGGATVPQYPIVWVDRDGRTSTLVTDPGTYAAPRLSPDGKRLALTVLRDNNWDIWVYDLERSVSTRFTFEETEETEAIWSPDGREIVFAVGKAGPEKLFRKPSDGSGAPQPIEIENAKGFLWPTSWSPDGRTLAVAGGPGGDTNLFVVSLDGEAEARPYLDSRFTEDMATFSPDGRWVAYMSVESGRPEIYVRPYPEGGGRWQVSDAGGTAPRWSGTGRELFYRTDEGIMVAPVDVQGGSFRTGQPKTLFTGAFQGGMAGMALPNNVFADYDVSRDGQRFVMFPAVGRENRVTEVTLVSSWLEELEQIFAPRSR